MNRFLSLLALALTVATACAQPAQPGKTSTSAGRPRTYTNRTDFVAALGTNAYYVNDFYNLNGMHAAEIDFSKDDMSYGITAPPDGLMFAAQSTNKFTCSYTDSQDLRVALTNVTAVGALVFLTEGWGQTTNGMIRVTFSDGVQTNVPSPSFIAHNSGGTPITSMVLHSMNIDGSHSPSLRDVFVARPAPSGGGSRK